MKQCQVVTLTLFFFNSSLIAKAQEFQQLIELKDIQIKCAQFTGIAKNDILIDFKFVSPTKKTIYVTLSDKNKTQLISDTLSLEPGVALSTYKKLGLNCHNPYYLTVSFGENFLGFPFNLVQPKPQEKDTIKNKLPGIPNG